MQQRLLLQKSPSTKLQSRTALRKYRCVFYRAGVPDSAIVYLEKAHALGNNIPLLMRS